jgi:hypothetical protein
MRSIGGQALGRAGIAGEGMRGWARAVALATPAVVFAVALALYVRTGAPSLLTGDQAEHQMVAVTLGVSHATGYPLFTLLNAAAVRLLPFGDLARRVTLMSSLWGALAVLLAFLATRRLSGSALAGIVAAATLAVAPAFWSLAVVAEVYTLQALLILLVWRCLMAWWRDEGRAAPLYGAALCSGLAASHHGSFVPIVAPAILLTAAWPLLRPRPDSPPYGDRWRRALGAVGWGLLGLAPWLYLAVQFALFRPFDYYRGEGLPYHYYWGNPASWGDVVNLALGAGFRGKIFTHGWANLAELALAFARTLRAEMGAVGLLLGAVGGLSLLLGPERRAGAFGGLVFVSAALFGLNVAGDVPKAGVYYLPAYVVWSVWAGVGAARLAQAARRALLRAAPPVAALAVAALALFVALPALHGRERLAAMDRSQDRAPREFAAAVLAEVRPGAAILCRWEHCRALQYLQLAEGRRLDVILDQTEPEAGVDWGERAALYLPERPVYAVTLNPQLAARYPIFPLSETYDLWEVLTEF